MTLCILEIVISPQALNTNPYYNTDKNIDWADAWEITYKNITFHSSVLYHYISLYYIKLETH